MSHITLRGHWCDIVVLNIQAPTQDKIDDMKGSFYKELECVFMFMFIYFKFKQIQIQVEKYVYSQTTGYRMNYISEQMFQLVTGTSLGKHNVKHT
jgi:hypothetical protein